MDPELDGIFAEILNTAAAELAGLRDPLQAEMLVSELLGIWSGQVLVDADPDVVFGEGLIEHAQRRGTPAALAMLRGIAAVGTDRQRTKAATAASALAARGVTEPIWADELAPVQVTDCWAYGDVYGDQTSMLLGFERGGEQHGLVVLIDHTLGGIAKDAFLADDPAAALAAVRAEADGLLISLREITPAEARGFVEPAISTTDMTFDPPLGDTYRATRALALARLRALPAPADPPVEPGEIGPGERAGIVAEFLASTHAAPLAERTAAQRCAELIVDHGCDHDEGRPLRVSPMKTEIFLMDWVPRTVVLSDAEQAAMPSVVAAWVRWAGERGRLPADALEELDEAAEMFGGQFPDAYADPDRAGLAKSLLAGLAGDVPDAETLGDTLDRRLFAMPCYGTRIGDEDYPRLDPGDEDERGLLITGEHPEYHEVLDDPTSEELIDETNPRLHIAMHELVANQLWHDDPPEAWQAAQRLTAAGQERHDVLHALGEVAIKHLWGALTAHEPVDLDTYRRDLDALGRLRAGRRGKQKGQPGQQQQLFDVPAAETPRPVRPRASGGPVASAYQVKITLRHVKPPVWRRLQLPGSITLGELHNVIQTAMGWEDYHLHVFTAGQRRYGRRSGDWYDWDPELCDEDAARLADVAATVGDKVRYEYDFGDGWEHDIAVEEITPAAGPVGIRCVAGRRACPPEDCGGPWGYAELCEAIADPGHERHDELLGWLGGHFNPAAFDRDAVNARLPARRR